MHDRMFPALRSEFRVDVQVHDDEIVVVVDLPGIEKEVVSIRLLNPRAFEGSCARKDETGEKSRCNYLRERMCRTMRRVGVLPADMTDSEANSSFTNGVLEIPLKRSTIAPVSRTCYRITSLPRLMPFYRFFNVISTGNCTDGQKKGQGLYDL